MTDNVTSKMNPTQLADWIGMLGFCAYDMMLYLDTHPDGEMGASMRYLSQRYATDNRKVSGLPDRHRCLGAEIAH